MWWTSCRSLRSNQSTSIGPSNLLLVNSNILGALFNFGGPAVSDWLLPISTSRRQTESTRGNEPTMERNSFMEYTSQCRRKTSRTAVKSRKGAARYSPLPFICSENTLGSFGAMRGSRSSTHVGARSKVDTDTCSSRTYGPTSGDVVRSFSNFSPVR